MTLSVLVVGGGIGGLTAALALRQAGLEAHVYEQASVLREVGAGVAIGPNAVKVLHRLGLAEALRSVGVVPRSMDPRDWQSGVVLARIPLAELAVERWGASFYHLHRADLHNALRAALGEESLTLAAHCVAVEQHGSTVRIRFADGREARATCSSVRMASIRSSASTSPARTGRSGRARSPGAAWPPLRLARR